MAASAYGDCMKDEGGTGVMELPFIFAQVHWQNKNVPGIGGEGG